MTNEEISKISKEIKVQQQLAQIKKEFYTNTYDNITLDQRMRSYSALGVEELNNLMIRCLLTKLNN